MHDAQLGAELARQTGCVDLSGGRAPTAPASRQQRVIGHQDLLDRQSAAQSWSLAAAGRFRRLPDRARGRAPEVLSILPEDDLTNHVFDIAILELHDDGKSPQQLLKLRGGMEFRLAGADKLERAAEALDAAFNDVLQIQDRPGILADELLQFIEHDQGAGQVAVFV